MKFGFGEVKAKEPRAIRLPRIDRSVSTHSPNDEPFDATSKLTFTRVKEVLTDPVVKFGLAFIGLAVSRVKLEVNGEDQQQVEYIREVFRPALMKDYFKKGSRAMAHGFAAMETIYAMHGQRVTLDPFQMLDPEEVNLNEDDDGALTGLTYSQPDGKSVMLEADAGKFVLVTNRYWETTSRYGVSELTEIREDFYRKRMIKDSMARWGETKANPPTICNYRNVKWTDGDGSAVDPRATALALAKAMRQGNNVAIPMDEESGEPLFKLEAFETGDRMPAYREFIDISDVQMLRGLVIPERALTQDTSTGSYGMATVHSDMFIQRQEDFADTMIRPLNQHIVPKLLAFMFTNPDPTVQLAHAGLQDEDRELVSVVINHILTAAQNGRPMTPEEVEWMRDRTGIPIDTTAYINKPETVRGPDVRIAAVEPRKGLWRKLTERELMMPGGQRYFMSFKGEMIGLEAELEAKLATLIQRQSELYLKSAEAALAKSGKIAQKAAARQIGLKTWPEVEAAIKGVLTRGAEAGASRVYAELGAKYTGLSNLVRADILTEAKLRTESTLGALLAKIRGQLVRGITQELDSRRTLFNLANAFTQFKSARAVTDTVRSINTSVNMARRQVEQVQLADPIVSATRTEAMDDATCEICERFDGQTIPVNHPDFASLVPPSGCLGGSNCRGIMMYNTESMRPGLRIVNYKPLPQTLQAKVWFREE